ncbi:MAG: hypothetical protein JNK94_09925 [Hyphomonadaceae bacterium]|nr:hypothetical protein [Hyphomonadaceae bacterium]
METADDRGLSIIDIARTDRVERTYNLTVSGPHTFLVGEDGAVVHNCLKFLHTARTHLTDRVAAASLRYWEGRSTDAIVRSFARDPLIVRTSDNMIMNGNTRALVLQQRGYDISTLPRTPYP